MATIHSMLSKVNRLDVKAESRKIIAETSGDIVKLNKEQLYSGLDVDGVKLGTRYNSITYALTKEQMNPKPGFGVMDFKLTGAFYRGFFVTVKKDTFVTDSHDDKTGKLEALQAGQKIFGLSKEHKYVYARGVFFDRLKGYIKSNTGLTFK